MTLLEAAQQMVKACDGDHTHSSLRAGCKFLHAHHPDHCAGKLDSFDHLHACSCTLNQLISALLHGQAALEEAIRESEA